MFFSKGIITIKQQPVKSVKAFSQLSSQRQTTMKNVTHLNCTIALFLYFFKWTYGFWNAQFKFYSTPQATIDHLKANKQRLAAAPGPHQEVIRAVWLVRT